MPLAPITACPVTDLLHGVQVVDRYRWLEERNCIETAQWIREQNLRHDAYFAQIEGLDLLRDRVRCYLNREIIDQPVRLGSRIFYRRRDDLHSGRGRRAYSFRSVLPGHLCLSCNSGRIGRWKIVSHRVEARRIRAKGSFHSFGRDGRRFRRPPAAGLRPGLCFCTGLKGFLLLPRNCEQHSRSHDPSPLPGQSKRSRRSGFPCATHRRERTVRDWRGIENRRGSPSRA